MRQKQKSKIKREVVGYKFTKAKHSCTRVCRSPPLNTTQQWQTDTHTQRQRPKQAAQFLTLMLLFLLSIIPSGEKKMKEKHLFFYYFLSRNLSNTLHSLSLELAFSFSLLSLLWLVYFCLVGVWVCACVRVYIASPGLQRKIVILGVRVWWTVWGSFWLNDDVMALLLLLFN